MAKLHRRSRSLWKGVFENRPREKGALENWICKVLPEGLRVMPWALGLRKRETGKGVATGQALGSELPNIWRMAGDDALSPNRTGSFKYKPIYPQKKNRPGQDWKNIQISERKFSNRRQGVG